jgi:hypothetical protein
MKRISKETRLKSLDPLPIPTSEGLKRIIVLSSAERTELGNYWNAVKRYLRTGEASQLESFTGRHITGAYGTKYPLITGLKELERLGSAGVLSFESIYRNR